MFDYQMVPMPKCWNFSGWCRIIIHPDDMEVQLGYLSTVSAILWDIELR
jgi:hypothetical protein